MITTEKINNFLTRKRESIIRKLTWTATIDETILEKKYEVKKGDIQ